MKSLRSRRSTKIWADIVIILFTFVAVVACITMLVTWRPGFIKRWPDNIQDIFWVVSIIGPIFIFIGVAAWRLEKRHEIPLRLLPLTSLVGQLVPMACFIAFINLALGLELIFLKSPAKETWVEVTIAADIFLVLPLTLIMILELTKQTRYKRILDRAPSNTVAAIRRLEMKAHTSVDDEGRVSTGYSYYAILEFSPNLAANSPKNMMVEALISESFYDKLKGTPFVNIRYAAENPRIFLIEGE